MQSPHPYIRVAVTTAYPSPIYKGRGDNRLCMYANKRTVQAVTTAVVAIAH